MLEPADPYEPGENFRFIASNRKIFSQIQKNENFLQLVCSAPKLGLLFASDTSLVKVFQIQEVVDKDNPSPLTEFEVSGGNITHISVSCDGLILIVVATINHVPNAFLFDIPTVAAAVPFYSAPLSTRPGSRVTSLAWNPTDPASLALAFSTGDLVSLNLKDSSVHFASHSEIGACVVSWSAKGKQLAVGKIDGTLALYKTDLTLVRSIAAPPLGRIESIVSITWFTNTEFFVGYLMSVGIPALCYVLAPKGAQPTFCNFEDVCYSNEDSRPIVYYNQFISEWNILLMLSSHGIEMGILGKSKAPDAKFSWCQWFPDEDAKAMMQFINVVEETYPLGFAIDFTSQKRFPSKDEKEKGPFPLLAVLSTGGELNLFHAENRFPDAAFLVKASEPIPSDKTRRPETYGQAPTSPFIRHPQRPKVEPPSATSGALPPAASLAPPVAAPPITPVAPPAVALVAPVAPVAPPTVTPVAPPTVIPVAALPPITPVAAPLPITPVAAPLPVTPVAAHPPVTPVAAAVTPQTEANVSCSGAQNGSFLTGGKGFSFSTPIKSSSSQPLPQQPLHSPSILPTATLDQSSSHLQTNVVTSFNVPITPAAPSQISTPKVSLAPAQQPTSSSPSSKVPPMKISNEAMITLLKREMEQFEREIQHHCRTTHNDQFQVGTKEEADSIVHNIKNVESLMKDIKSTTEEQSTEVCQLHQGIIDAFTIYEDAKSHSSVKRNLRNLTYLQLRPLDPYSRKKLDEIRSKYSYLASQIADANTKLDLEWEEFCEQKKYKRCGPAITGETLYRSILNLHHLRISHEKSINLLQERVKTLFHGSFSSLGQFRSNDSTPGELKSSFAFGQENAWKVSSPIQSLPPQKMQDLQKVLSQRQITPIRNRSTSKFHFSSSNNESFDATSLPIFPELEYSQKYEDISEPNSPDRSQDNIPPNPLAALKYFVGSVETSTHESSTLLPTIEKDAKEKLSSFTLAASPSVTSLNLLGLSSKSAVASATGVASETFPSINLPISSGNNVDIRNTNSSPFLSKPLPGASSQPPFSFDGMKPEEKLDSLFKVVSSSVNPPSLVASVQSPSSSTLGGLASIFSLPASAPFSVPSTTTSFSFFSSTSKDSPSPIPQGTTTFATGTPIVSTVSSSLLALPASSKSSIFSSTASFPVSTLAPSSSLFTTTSSFSISQDSTLSPLFAPVASTVASPFMLPSTSSSQVISSEPQISSNSAASSIFAKSYFSTPTISSTTTTTSQSIASSIFTTSTSDSSQSSSVLSISGPFSSRADSPGLLSQPSLETQAFKSFGNSGGMVLGTSLFGESKIATSGGSLFGGELHQSETELGTSTQSVVKELEDGSLNIANAEGSSASNEVVSSSLITGISEISPFTSAPIVSSVTTDGKLSSLLNTTSGMSVFGMPINSSGIFASASSSGNTEILDKLVNSNNDSGSSSIFKTLPSTEGKCADGLFNPNSLAMSTASESIFNQPTTTSPGIFGNAVTTLSSSGFFSQSAPSTTATTGNLFESNTVTITTTSGGTGMFGNTFTTTTNTGIFGSTTQPAVFVKTETTSNGSAANSTSFFNGGANKSFGNTPSNESGGGLFGGSASTASIFGGTPTSGSSASVFGAAITSASVFGGSATIATGQGLFGGTASNSSGTIFGESSASGAGTGIFGSSATSGATGSPFGGTAITSSPGITGGTFGNNQPNPNSSNWNTPAFGQATNAPSPFSGASMFTGLGGTPSKESTSKNVFGSITTVDQPQTNIFGNQQSTPFGSVKQEAVAPQSPFSGGGSFSPVKSSPSFGASATFGGSPAGFSGSKFGTSPIFGGTSSFGSIGSGGGGEAGAGGFSNFATSGGATFSSLAVAPQPPPPQANMFGGQTESQSTFGAMNQNTNTGSFAQPGFSGTSFTSWR